MMAVRVVSAGCTWRRTSLLAALVASAYLAAPVAQAQTDTTARRADTTAARRPDSAAASPMAARSPFPRFTLRARPPISSRRAFLLSLAVPGLGQSRLERGSSGALFASVEVAALTMVRRSLRDVRETRRFRLDSLPTEFVARADGTVQPAGARLPDRYSPTLERQRRLQVEDWLAVVAFNHLLAGADALVSAQLWDVPVDVAAVPARRGAWLTASVRW